jgi:hypothetical protein
MKILFEKGKTWNRRGMEERERENVLMRISRLLSFDMTWTAYKTTPSTILRCHGNVFTVPLPRNDMGDTHTHWWEWFMKYAIDMNSGTMILWHICSRQELWSRQRQPLLRNGSANTPVARQQIRNRQQWSNWAAVFSTRSVDTYVTHQYKNGWKRCFLCGTCRVYITGSSCDYERESWDGS